jgi:hypothetical protein
MDCLIATLSVDPVKSHEEWIRDVVSHCDNKIEVKFPIIGDADRSISKAYGMIDVGSSDEQELPLTIRYVSSCESLFLLLVCKYISDLFLLLQYSIHLLSVLCLSSTPKTS